MSTPAPTPFRIEIPEDRLHDLRRRLASIRWAPDFANDDWRYGTNGKYLRELVAYWHDGYDWRAREKRINAYPQFKVEIDGMPIHFLHVKAKHPEKCAGGRPLPLLLTHGWPWTFWDFEKVIGPLTDPGAFGGDPKDAFDVVVPSLPGFGFSTPLTTPGINWWRTADLWATLMRDVLGHERFCAHGGDWGALVTLQLGHRYADRVHGVHITGIAPLEFFSGDRPWSIGGSLDTIAKGTGEKEALLAWERKFASHVAVQHLDPQSLAFAMHDSPMGLCAWILERRRSWGDTHGDVESRFTKDELLDTMSIYWLTDSFVTSVRYYAEAGRNPWKPDYTRESANKPIVAAPTGITLFKPDMAPGDMSWSETYFNRVQFRVHEKGGHFAPAEEPAVLVTDIRDMFRRNRG
ncbi:MAG: alpha/beta fold hydrolase [Deltaproteobacteria bacterium]|nr:alpha/beta fold hydrolase [Deltaproteobacteria bacterium]